MKMTILYDNESQAEGLKADWGFSCLIEYCDRRILFDTGTNGKLLLENMEALGVNPISVDDVFISHSHFDHMGGLSAFLGENHDVKIFAPPQIRGIAPAREVIYVDKPMKLSEKVYTTGLLEGIEQSMVIEMENGLVVVVGCSHPGVGNILDAARAYGTPYALIGGLHGFNQFEVLKPLQLVSPTHCTQHISEIKSLYPEKYIGGGVGAIIEI